MRSVLLCALIAGIAARPLKLRQKDEPVPVPEFLPDTDPGHKDPAVVQLCLGDGKRVKPLTSADMSARHQIQHWARTWKVPDENTTDYFMHVAPKIKKIFYINVDADGDRKNFMEEQLRNKTVNPSSIPFERWSATPMDKLTKSDEERWLFSNAGIAPYVQKMKNKHDRQATKSVYYSHAKLLKHILETDPNGTSPYVIMEDDTGLDPFWHSKLMEHMKWIPKDWDLLRFVYWGAKRCEDKIPGTESWYEARGPDRTTDGKTSFYAGNQAYMVRPQSIPDLLEQLRALPVMDIDGALGSAHKEGHNTTKGNDISWSWGVHTYVLQWPLGWHKNLGSSRLKKQEKGFDDLEEDLQEAIEQGQGEEAPRWDRQWVPGVWSP